MHSGFQPQAKSLNHGGCYKQTLKKIHYLIKHKTDEAKQHGQHSETNNLLSKKSKSVQV